MPTIGAVGSGISVVVVAFVALLVLVLAPLVLVLVARRRYLKIDSGRALIVHKGAGPQVSFTGRLVLPLLHRAELLDLTARSLEVERSGRRGLLCRDNIRADVCARFVFRVNRTVEDVLRVAETIGCARAADREALRELFEARFAAGLETAARMLDFEALSRDRARFVDEVFAVVGRDLSGFILEDVAIEEFEQTPISALDPNDIFDAEGIRRITERTVAEQIGTNELRLALELVRRTRGP